MMAEVIDLLSSSPPRLPEKSVSANGSRDRLSKDTFNFDSDDFNVTGDLDFLTEQPAKRKRLSPSPTLPQPIVKASLCDDGIFDLLSEGDNLPFLNQTYSKVPTCKSGAAESDVDKNYVFRFSSSAPEPVSKGSDEQIVILELSSDHEPAANDSIQSSSQPPAPSRPVFSERTANLLAGLRTSNVTSSTRQVGKGKARRSISVDVKVTGMDKFKQITKSCTIAKDDITDSSQPERAKKKSKDVPKHSSKDDQGKPVSRAASKAERDAEKEAEKERRRKDKERKAQEKQKAADIAEANKSKTNKKNSTSEMIVDMPTSLRGLSVGNQVEEYMKQLNVEVTFSRDEEAGLTGDTEAPLGNVIRWRRKVMADFNDDLEIWKPLDRPRVSRVNHVLVYLKAEEFINIAAIGHYSSSSSRGDSEISESVLKTNIDGHIHFLRSRYPNSTMIYLIEGLSAWNRKSQTLKNRAYTAAVRSQTLDEEVSTSTAPPPSQSRHANRTTKPKRKTSRPQLDLSCISPSLIETLLLHLQLHHQPLLIHHTTSPATTATQIQTLTQHLSTRPYRLTEQSHNLASASFCMTTGQIRTGATPHETYINMLQEVNRVTPSMAYGISSAGYKNVGELVRGFRNNGNLMLEDVRKSVNKDGGWSDRRLGPMVSKRLFKVFMGRDPGARDGIA